ncbi:MAG: glycosyltransferase family A protein [Desulfomonilaceae bacterium]
MPVGIWKIVSPCGLFAEVGDNSSIPCVVCQENGGPAKARNTGARESKGEMIFFTDSDTIPRSNWISTSLSYFYDNSVAVAEAVTGLPAMFHQRNLLRSTRRISSWRMCKLILSFRMSIRAILGFKDACN